MPSRGRWGRFWATGTSACSTPRAPGPSAGARSSASSRTGRRERGSSPAAALRPHIFCRRHCHPRSLPAPTPRSSRGTQRDLVRDAAKGLAAFARDTLTDDPLLAASIAVAFGAELPPDECKKWTARAKVLLVRPAEVRRAAHATTGRKPLPCGLIRARACGGCRCWSGCDRASPSSPSWRTRWGSSSASSSRASSAASGSHATHERRLPRTCMSAP